MDKEGWERARNSAVAVFFAGCGLLALFFTVVALGLVPINQFTALLIVFGWAFGGFCIGFAMLPSDLADEYRKTTGKRW